MTIILPALAVAFAAFCVWLGVRIINRRERWAKRLAVGLFIGLPVFYVFSFGPACWMVKKKFISAEHVAWAYAPLALQVIGDRGPLGRIIWSYGGACGGYASIATVHNYGVAHSHRWQTRRAVH